MADRFPNKPAQAPIDVLWLLNIGGLILACKKKKYSEMVTVLIEEYGYNELSAEEVLTYAANNLWRDS